MSDVFGLIILGFGSTSVIRRNCRMIHMTVVAVGIGSNDESIRLFVVFFFSYIYYDVYINVF